MARKAHLFFYLLFSISSRREHFAQCNILHSMSASIYFLAKKSIFAMGDILRCNGKVRKIENENRMKSTMKMANTTENLIRIEKNV